MVLTYEYMSLMYTGADSGRGGTGAPPPPPPPPPLQLEKIRLFGVKSESKLINGVAGKTTGHVILI